MPRKVHFDSTVKGGFPVSVEASICPAEPDVGIFESYGEDILLFNQKTGKLIGDWLKVSKDDWDRLMTEAGEHAHDDYREWERE